MMKARIMSKKEVKEFLKKLKERFGSRMRWMSLCSYRRRMVR